MMINNNPYNLPQRPPNKQNRVYTESNANQFRSQLVQNSVPYGQQYINRPVPTNLIQKKNSITIQQSNSFRQQYPPIRNQIKHFLPSPKNQNSSSSNINNFNNVSNNRSNVNAGSSIEKKQLGHANSLRQSLGNTNLDMKELNQRMQSISLNLRIHEKRINELQKNSSNGFLPNSSNNSKISNQMDSSYLNTTQAHIFMSKYQNQWTENMNKFKQQIQKVKEQIKLNNSKNFQANKNINDQIRDLTEHSNKSNESTFGSQKSSSQELKKQIENVKLQLEQKIKKNYDFLTSVIGRVQRQFHNGIVNIQPNFRPSTIKCTNTAILLRFVQCFKVRKHSAKSGQIKITLSDNTYYIDNEGYLLDKQQFYLLDNRGNKVKLQQKHIKLLKQQNILC